MKERKRLTRCWQLTCKFPTWWSPYPVQLRSQQFLKGHTYIYPAPLSMLISHPLASGLLTTLQLFVKIQVSSFTRSKYMQAVPKFKNSAPGPDHAPFGSILSWMRLDLPRSIRIPKSKCLALTDPKIRRTCHAMARCARGCAQTSAWNPVDLCRFLSDPHHILCQYSGMVIGQCFTLMF